jgi:predicted phosphoribosyltransferase
MNNQIRKKEIQIRDKKIKENEIDHENENERNEVERNERNEKNENEENEKNEDENRIRLLTKVRSK